MNAKIYVAPYVRGPTVAADRSKSPGSNGSSKASGAPRAYRATNYRQLQSAGLVRAVESPATGVAISSHLDLEAVDPDHLHIGDVILVEIGQTIPVDGVVLEGIAVVDESAVTGQSAPVIRQSGGVKEVMRDTRVVDGHVFVEVASRRGHPLDWIGGTVLPKPVRVEAEVGRR